MCNIRNTPITFIELSAQSLSNNHLKALQSYKKIQTSKKKWIELTPSTHPLSIFFFWKPIIIKDFNFFAFPIFYFLSKMALDPPTNFQFLEGCLEFFLTLQHPLVHT